MDILIPKFKNHIFVDMDGVLPDFESKVRQLSGCISSIDTQEWDKVADYYSKQPHFFADLDPIEGSIDAYHQLCTKFDVHILSTAPWDNPSAWHDKRIWVEKHLGQNAYKKLTLSHHKELFCGRALIDDRTKNGAAEFNGEHIQFGTDKFPNWNSIINYLM